MYGQNRHRTVPFHLHPPATHLAMQPASRLRHLYLDCSAAGEDLFDTARRRLESAIGTLSVLDLLDETEDRRKHRRITGSLLSLFEAEYARRHR